VPFEVSREISPTPVPLTALLDSLETTAVPPNPEKSLAGNSIISLSVYNESKRYPPEEPKVQGLEAMN